MRTKRSGRLAACTAIALAAGMLLSGTASADGKPAPAPKIERPKGQEHPTGTLPKTAPKGATKGTPKAQQRSAAGADAATGSQAPLFDVNGDGRDDVLYRGLNGSSYLKTFSGEEDTDFYVDGAGYGEDFKDVIPVGDLDRDGQPELLRLSVDGRLSLVSATSVYGTSSTSGAWSGGGWNIYNKVVGVGDVTGDGNPDALARTPNGDLYLYPGNGKAGASDPFRSRVLIGGGWNAYAQLVGGGDFDSDGKPDLLATTPDGLLYFYKGTGSGTFAGRVKTGTGWNTYNQLKVLSSDDGRSWVMGRSLGGTTYIYPSSGNGYLGDRSESGSGWEYINLIAGQGGVPAHGRSDLYARTGAGALYGYSGRMNGTFGDRELILGNGDLPSDISLNVTSSLDQSNESDALVMFDGELWHGDNLVGRGWDIYNSIVGVGDLNGDGYGDLLGRDKSNVLWFYGGRGNGYQFASRIRIGAGWGIFNKFTGAGDVTGDGRADLIARGNDGTLWVYPGTGSSSGVLGNRVLIGEGGWNGFTKIAAVGDITGDGRTDVVGVNSSGTAYLYSATGEKGLSTFKSRSTIGSGWNTYNDLR